MQRKSAERRARRPSAWFDVENPLRFAQPAAQRRGGLCRRRAHHHTGGGHRPAPAGILGTVASQIRVPGASWKKPWKTALGGALQNVIVRRWDYVAHGHRLAETEPGRAGHLFAARPAGRQQPIPAPLVAGVLGVAADSVRIRTAALETAVEHLLYRPRLYRRWMWAAVRWTRWRRSPPTVVTTDGESTSARRRRQRRQPYLTQR